MESGCERRVKSREVRGRGGKRLHLGVGGGGGTLSGKGYQLWSDCCRAVAVAPRDGLIRGLSSYYIVR